MNFLAHMFLTYGEKELSVGNFIADFIRNRDLILFDDDVIRGVKLHRFIDHYTDNHPEVVKSTRVLYDRHKKYAPVVIDVFYDYILAQNWSTFTTVDMRTFADNVYAYLNAYTDDFPIHLQEITTRMIADDFLIQYGQEDGIQKTLKRIGRRAKFDSNFETAFDDLKKHYELINEGFLRFFPDLVHEVKTFQ